MSVSDGSPMKHVEVSDQGCRSPMGLQSGMSVFDGSPMGFVNQTGILATFNISEPILHFYTNKFVFATTSYVWQR